MKDYGASLEWPQPPRALKQTALKFQVLSLIMFQIVKKSDSSKTRVLTVVSIVTKVVNLEIRVIQSENQRIIKF